jgi:hypothetical protein
MTIPATSSESVLQELAAWCQLAHDVLRSSQQPLEKVSVRTLKQQLLRHHTRHLAQLREWLGRRKAGGRFARKRPEAWAEVVNAMRSRDEYVAIAGCALLERAVLAAYEKAADHIWLENTAMRLVRRQRLVLKSCHAQYLRRPTSPGERATRAATGSRPAFSALVAIAS